MTPTPTSLMPVHTEPTAEARRARPTPGEEVNQMSLFSFKRRVLRPERDRAGEPERDRERCRAERRLQSSFGQVWNARSMR